MAFANGSTAVDTAPAPQPEPMAFTGKDAPPAVSEQQCSVRLRAPAEQPAWFTNPPLDFFPGTWQITHSSLPFWKNKHGIRITYSVSRDGADGQGRFRLDDLIEYCEAGATKVKSVKGRESCGAAGDTGHWDWRGQGIIKVASSTWEVLGWGSIVDGKILENVRDAGQGTEYMITWFKPTVFTPMAVDVYVKTRENADGLLLNGVKKALEGMGNGTMRKLAGELYELGP